MPAGILPGRANPGVPPNSLPREQLTTAVQPRIQGEMPARALSHFPSEKGTGRTVDCLGYLRVVQMAYPFARLHPDVPILFMTGKCPNAVGLTGVPGMKLLRGDTAEFLPRAR